MKFSSPLIFGFLRLFYGEKTASWVKAVCNSFCFGKSDTVNRYKPKLIFSYGYYWKPQIRFFTRNCTSYEFTCIKSQKINLFSQTGLYVYFLSICLQSCKIVHYYPFTSCKIETMFPYSFFKSPGLNEWVNAAS